MSQFFIGGRGSDFKPKCPIFYVPKCLGRVGVRREWDNVSYFWVFLKASLAKYYGLPSVVLNILFSRLSQIRACSLKVINPILRGVTCQLISRGGRGGGVKSKRLMVFALATCRSHEKFSAFTHIKYRQFFSDIKRENQNCRKIGSVARKIKKSILSNFFSIESTSKISDLRHKKLNFSSQKHHRGVNSFDNEN